MSENTGRLDAIQARVDAATPGPWDYEPFDGSFGIYSLEQRDNGDFPAILGYYASEGEGGTEADAEFIAAAPSDVAFLLDLARKQGAALTRVDKARQELFEISNDGDWTDQARAVYRDASRAIREALDPTP